MEVGNFVVVGSGDDYFYFYGIEDCDWVFFFDIGIFFDMEFNESIRYGGIDLGGIGRIGL